MLLLLLPVAVAAWWLWSATATPTQVPSTVLWRAMATRRGSQSRRPPPLPVLLLLIATVLAVLALAQPALQHGRQLPLTVSVDALSPSRLAEAEARLAAVLQELGVPDNLRHGKDGDIRLTDAAVPPGVIRIAPATPREAEEAEELPARFAPRLNVPADLPAPFRRFATAYTGTRTPGEQSVVVDIGGAITFLPFDGPAESPLTLSPFPPLRQLEHESMLLARPSIAPDLPGVAWDAAGNPLVFASESPRRVALAFDDEAAESAEFVRFCTNLVEWLAETPETQMANVTPTLPSLAFDQAATVAKLRPMLVRPLVGQWVAVVAAMCVAVAGCVVVLRQP